MVAVDLHRNTCVRRALVLAAGTGRRLGPLTATRPKCLLEVNGSPLLYQLLHALSTVGVNEWVIVVGYRRELVQIEVSAWNLSPRSLRWVVNPEYRHTNTLASVATAARELRGEPFLLVNGDLWIRPHALQPLLRGSHDSAMLIDRSVTLDHEAMKVIVDDRARVCRLGKQLSLAAASGESIGAYRFGADRGARFLDAVAARRTAGDVQAFYEAALDDLATRGMRATAVDVPPDAWAEIDDARDLARANVLAATPHRATGS